MRTVAVFIQLWVKRRLFRKCPLCRLNTWTCCDSMQYCRFSTYSHTLFFHKMALPLVGVSNQGCTWSRNYRESGSREKANSLGFLFLRTPSYGVMSRALLPKMMTWRSASPMWSWLFVLTCSSEHGKSLDLDWTLSVLPRVTTLRCWRPVTNFESLITTHRKGACV